MAQYLLLALVADRPIEVAHQVRDDPVAVEEGVVHVEQEDDRHHAVYRTMRCAGSCIRPASCGGFRGARICQFRVATEAL